MRLPSCASVCVLLAGCKVGPDWARPDQPMPAAFPAPQLDPAATASKVTGEPADVASWWQVFGDQELDALIARAVEANLDLAAAAARVRQARAARAIVAGGLWPALDTPASVQRAQTGTAPAGTSLQVGFDASWELDVFGGIRRDVEAADADLQAAVEDRRDVLVTLTSEVALNYLALRGLQERLRVAGNNLAAQQRSVDITQRRFEGGLTSRLDVANAQAQVAITRAEIPPLQASAQQAIYNLGVLLGGDPAGLDQELAAAGPIPEVPATIPAGLPSDLLRRRPDIRRSEANLHAATARVGVATADLFPRFSLTAFLGFQHDELPGLFDARQRSWSAAANLFWPLFAGGSITANIARSEAVVDEALLQYRATVLAALRDVDTTLHALGREQERLAALRQSVDANRRSVDLSTRLYTEGQTDFLSVIVAQRLLLQAEDSLAQSQTAVATDLVALFKALGGGWEDGAGG